MFFGKERKFRFFKNFFLLNSGGWFALRPRPSSYVLRNFVTACYPPLSVLGTSRGENLFFEKSSKTFFKEVVLSWTRRGRSCPGLALSPTYSWTLLPLTAWFSSAFLKLLRFLKTWVRFTKFAFGLVLTTGLLFPSVLNTSGTLPYLFRRSFSKEDFLKNCATLQKKSRKKSLFPFSPKNFCSKGSRNLSWVSLSPATGYSTPPS